MRAKTDMEALFRRLDSEARNRQYELLSDGALLGRFVQMRDAPSFDELLRRHGPMVWGICQRILGATHDADDAFQAVFLVLLRKAHRLQRRDLFAHWLCVVAYKTARHAQRRLWKIGQRERPHDTLPEREELPPPSDDWRPLFDAAVQRLPAKYREPVVLCELQGLSRAEAARVLKLNEGTLSSRLGRARDLLRMKLGRYGLPLVWGAALTPSTLPLLLANSTTAAALNIGAATVTAITLTKGVLTAMFLTKVKTITFVTTCCAVGLVAGFGPTGPATTGAYEPDLLAQKSPKPEPRKLEPKPAPATTPKDTDLLAPLPRPTLPLDMSNIAGKQAPSVAPLSEELKPLQGHWMVAETLADGLLKEASPQQPLVEIVHNVMLVGERFMRLTVDANTAPKRLLMKDVAGPSVYCIYRCDGQSLTIAQTTTNNKTVPVDFEPTPGVVIIHYRRVDPTQFEDRLVLPRANSFDVREAADLAPVKRPPIVIPPDVPRSDNRIPPPEIPLPKSDPSTPPPAPPLATPKAEFAYPKSGLVLTTKQFQVPVSFTAKNNLLAAMLMISADGGKTWQLVEMGVPSELKSFTVTVPKAGTYHFAVITVSKDQKMDPPQIANLKPQLTVDVVDNVPGLPTPRETELQNQVKQLQQRLRQFEGSIPPPVGNLGIPQREGPPSVTTPLPNLGGNKVNR